MAVSKNYTVYRGTSFRASWRYLDKQKNPIAISRSEIHIKPLREGAAEILHSTENGKLIHQPDTGRFIFLMSESDISAILASRAEFYQLVYFSDGTRKKLVYGDLNFHSL